MDPMRVGIFILSVFSLALAGCASYSIQPICSEEGDPWKEKAPKEGFVFCQSELYFLVTPSGSSSKTNSGTSTVQATPTSDKTSSEAAFSVTPIYLPNPEKSYRVTTFNFLAKSDFAFNFKDGWQLTSIADKADNST